MEYKTFGTEYLKEIKEIYESDSWFAYLQDDEQVKRSFDNSIYVLGAFSEGKLIGFIRCVGDGEHIIMVQDLIIKPEYHRKGVGTMLLNKAIEKYEHVRIFCLFTNMEDERDNLFYQSKGLRTIENKKLIAYMR